MAHPTPINPDDMPQWMQQAKRGTDWGLLIVVILSLLIAWVFFTSNRLSQMNDSMPLALRTAETSQALREGRLYPRWSPFANDGYGAPIPHFDPPAVRYFAAMMDVLFTNDIIQAIQWIYVFVFVLAGISVYLLVIEFYHRSAGLLASLLYVTSPYIALQLPHIDGDLPQFMALALLPSVLWSLTRVIKYHHTSDISFAILSLALLILTSPLHSLSIIVLMMPILIHERECITRDSIILYTGVIALAIGITAFYWLPAIADLQSIKWIIPSPELNDSVTIFGLFAPIYRLDRASLLPSSQLTLGVAISASLVLLGFVLWKTRGEKQFSLFWLGLSAYFLLIYLIFLPSVSFFLGIITFCCVMTISYLGNIIVGFRLWVRLAIWFTIIGCVIILTLPIWSNPKPVSAIRILNPTQDMLKREQISAFLGNIAYDAPHPLLDLDVNPITLEAMQSNQSWRIHSASNVQVNFIEEQSHISRFQVNSSNNGYIVFNRAYYAGWQVIVESMPMKTFKDEATGLVRVELPDTSEGVLTLRFGTTATRIFSWIICLISLALTATLIIWQAQRKQDYILDDSPLIPRTEAFIILGTLGILLITLNLPIIDDALMHLRLPANARFDAASVVRINSTSGLRLNGFTLLDDGRTDKSINIELYWTLIRPLNSDIRVRLHLINSSDQSIYTISPIRVPANYPTYLWVDAGYIRDKHQLQIPATLPDGRYIVALELLNCQDMCVSSATFTNMSGIELTNPLPLPNLFIDNVNSP